MDQGVSWPQWLSFFLCFSSRRMSLERKPKAWSGWEEGRGEGSRSGGWAGLGRKSAAPACPGRGVCVCTFGMWLIHSGGSHVQPPLPPWIRHLEAKFQEETDSCKQMPTLKVKLSYGATLGGGPEGPTLPCIPSILRERGEAPSPALYQPLSY